MFQSTPLKGEVSNQQRILIKQMKWWAMRVGVGFWLLGQMVLAHGIEIGESIPTLYGRQLGGELFRLTPKGEGYRLINLFWVQCKPCVLELPQLAKLEQSYPKVTFYALHLGLEEESNAVIQTFIKRLPAAPQRVMAMAAIVKEQLRAQGMPYSLLIDPNGQVVATFKGYDEDQGVKKIEQQLERLVR